MPTIAARRISLLVRTGKMIFATTRTVDQYQRLGSLTYGCRFAVCAGGGVLLEDMHPRPDWTAECLHRLRSSGWSHKELEQTLKMMLRDGKSEEVHGAIGLAACRMPCRPATSRHSQFLHAASHLGLCGSWTGTKAYLQVKGTGKADAVHWALHGGARLVAAAGDAELDRRLLETADSSYTPQGGELAKSPSPRITVVRGLSPSVVIADISLQLLKAMGLNEPVRN